MTSLLCSVTGALLLLLSTGARADSVTWSLCKEESDIRGRVRAPGTDYNATSLNLNSCNIEDLPNDAFIGLPNTVNIDLFINKIKHVNPAVFIPVRNITGRLALLFNQLREVPNFGSHSLFPRLRQLDLNHNLITALDNPNALSACAQLEVLHLHHNNIHHIHPDYFTALKHLDSLWLSNNNIKIMTDNMFNIKSLSYLYLENNNIEYVPPRSFRGSELIQLTLNNNFITQLPANFVSELNRAGASLDTLYVYGNRWQCACLLELLADMKRIKMYNERYDNNIGDNDWCVYTGPYPCLRHPPTGLLSPPPLTREGLI